MPAPTQPKPGSSAKPTAKMPATSAAKPASGKAPASGAAKPGTAKLPGGGGAKNTPRGMNPVGKFRPPEETKGGGKYLLLAGLTLAIGIGGVVFSIISNSGRKDIADGLRKNTGPIAASKGQETPAPKPDPKAAPKPDDKSVEDHTADMKDKLLTTAEDMDKKGPEVGAPTGMQGWSIENLHEEDKLGDPISVAEKFFNSMIEHKSAKSFKKTYEMDLDGQTMHFYSVETIERWSNKTGRVLLNLIFMPNQGPNGETGLYAIQEVDGSDPNYAKYSGAR